MAGVAEGGDTVGADPVVAAVVLAVPLFPDALLQHLLAFLPGTGQILLGDILLAELLSNEIAALAHLLLHLLQHLLRVLRADLAVFIVDFPVVEKLQEGLSEPVVVGL